MTLLKPPQSWPGTARLSPGRAHAGRGAPEPGKIPAETIPTPWVWPPGHRNKQSYLRTQSCPSLEELMGIFPRVVAKNSRLCCCLGLFCFVFNYYYYFGKALNGFFGVGHKEGKELVKPRCIPAHFSWVWLLPTTPGVWRAQVPKSNPCTGRASPPSPADKQGLGHLMDGSLGGAWESNPPT